MNFDPLIPSTPSFENTSTNNNSGSNVIVQNSSKQDSPFTQVPVELIVRILLYVDLDIIGLKQNYHVEKKWAVACENDFLWRNIRLKLEYRIFDPSRNEKYQVKTGLDEARLRALNRYYYFQDVVEGFKQLHEDEEGFKRKEIESAALAAKSSKKKFHKIVGGFSSLFKSKECKEPSKIYEKSIMIGEESSKPSQDPATMRLYACIYSEDIEVINRLRKAIDLIQYLRNKFGSYREGYIINKVTPILTAEDFSKAYFEDKFDTLSIEDDSLTNRKLTSLPEQIGKVCNLHTLDLSHNAFTSFPQVILELKKLKELDISHNYITSIPEAIWGLVSKGELKINLDNNPLKLLPEQTEILKNQGAFTSMEILRTNVEKAKNEYRCD